ncbi:hypothetical protein SLEP1_g27221 [Rubroshorea leprosula]|uniref:Integrase catalytic domain-containing protein n=1 Tax=Rubroshorea leprosula TaxID=152421 RepID=A0AAV5JPJ1_9ROSI|nr:hypothetical protein SLEP1_g27221 [Rubroshorea leprosula]
MVENSFPLDLEKVQQCFSTSKIVDADLWHKRYGHFNVKGLKFMQTHEFVRDLPELQLTDSVCESCQLGKMHKLPFPVNKSFRATQKLELVHMDICGPMRTPSLSQNRYFILFINDFTRMTWVYFLGSKGQALPVFKKFKALVENQSGCRIKKLRSDNGKEYTSNDFNLFCEEAGVDHQLTVSYTPQQNGIAERKNRTVMEMARCMLAKKKLPKCFWAEAVYTAVYLLNAAKRGKLDEKAEIGIFIGYATQAKGYKVYDPISKKVNVHKDVVFDESAHWNWDAGKIEKDSNKQCEAGSNVVSSSEIAKVDDDSPVFKTKSLAEIYAKCNLASAEPNCFKEATKQQVWIDAMKEELSMIEKNQTWCLIPKPDDKKPIGVKWLFRTKLNPDGSIHKHKARLVVKRYAQQPRVDYEQTYAPVARHDTIRLLIALAANFGWKLFHMDVKSAFLNGVLQEEIYVEQPPGLEIAGKEDYVYKLNKALYGLKQAPRAWYCRIDDYLMSQGFRTSTKEATLYVKGSSNESQLILSLYVDDLLLTGNDLKLMEQFKKVMMQEFAMKNLGETKYFLRLEVQQLSKGIFICQRKYALDILKKFEMESCKPVATPLVQYEKLSKDDRETKVDSSYYRSLIAPSKLHLVAAKRVLRYIKGTYELGLWFDSNQQGRLQGYADSDWAGSMEDMISTIAEAEYLAAGAVANHAIWLRMVLEELGFDQIEPCVLKVDNMSAIAIAQNPVQHGQILPSVPISCRGISIPHQLMSDGSCGNSRWLWQQQQIAPTATIDDSSHNSRADGSDHNSSRVDGSGHNSNRADGFGRNNNRADVFGSSNRVDGSGNSRVDGFNSSSNNSRADGSSNNRVDGFSNSRGDGFDSKLQRQQ